MLHSPDSAIVQSELFGGRDGTKFDDLRTLGWPEEQPIHISHPISQIVIRSGAVIDGINVTYNLKSGGTTTICHGSQTGGTATIIDISADEVITSVIGRVGTSTEYGRSILFQLTIIIVNKKNNNVRVCGRFGDGKGNQGHYFQASGVVAFAGVETDNDQAGISGLSFFASKAWL